MRWKYHVAASRVEIHTKVDTVIAFLLICGLVSIQRKCPFKRWGSLAERHPEQMVIRNSLDFLLLRLFL